MHTIRTTNVNYNETFNTKQLGLRWCVSKADHHQSICHDSPVSPFFFNIKLPSFPFLILATAWLLGPCVHWAAVSLRLRQTRMKWRCLCEEEAASRLSPVPVCWKKGISVEALFWWVRWWAAFAFLVGYLIRGVAVCGLV